MAAKIAVEAQPGSRLVRDGQLDALALAGAPGHRHGLVAAERRLAGEVEDKERAFKFQFRQGLRPYSNLVAGRFGQ